MIFTLLKCILGPTLYGCPDNKIGVKEYKPNSLEQKSHKLMTLISVIYRTGKVLFVCFLPYKIYYNSTPVVNLFRSYSMKVHEKCLSSEDYEVNHILDHTSVEFLICLKDQITFGNIKEILSCVADHFFPVGLNFIALALLTYTTSKITRGIGRCFNSDYRQFLKALKKVEGSKDPEIKSAIQRYDFDFKYWPIVYHSKASLAEILKIRSKNWTEFLSELPYRLGSISLIRTFGLYLAYPGSISALQSTMSVAICSGRIDLIISGGKRVKVKTPDGNDIDTMYIKQSTPQGETLVITCDGNGGFYEIGVGSIPMSAGYSILSWNHPGFWGSTGKPYPSQEVNAINSVIQYAIDELKYDIKDIILYGWSIGGFTASWGAMNYPSLKGVILDATFDNIKPLAANALPWAGKVSEVGVDNYLNLDVASQINKYYGPLKIIRRTMDEIITTKNLCLSTNRGNNLLISILKNRYPLLIQNTELLEKILSEAILSSDDEEEDEQFKKILEYDEKQIKNYLMTSTDVEKSNLMHWLIRGYLIDLDMSHCGNFPGNVFIEAVNSMNQRNFSF